MPERVTILGNGAMATVCAGLLVAGGHDVTLWGAFPASIDRLKHDRSQDRLLPGARVPDAVRLTADDADALAAATLILSAIPTQHMRAVWERLRPHAPAGVPIVTVAKGVENETLLRPTQVIADVLGGWDRNPPAALSGPNIAAEIWRRLPATAVAAAADPAVADRVRAAFATPWFRVYTNPDVVGVELAGATKNVIAIAAGVLEGLAAGNNVKASLVTRGIVEITRLGVAMGAQASTFAGLAGLGDLITTCFSPSSRNRTVGERIGRGETLEQIRRTMESVAEGVPTTKSVVQLARRHGVEMPITEAVHAILFEGKPAGGALTDLMTRDPKPEWQD
jgi:glycerol-3-phosphate dehydrogenase (NAD(P)+)